MNEQIKKEASKFQRGGKAVSERRRRWSDFEDEASRIFEEVVNLSKEEGLFENLYVRRTERDEQGRLVPPCYITLFWGNHPTGEIDFRSKSREALDVEGGCALHLVQGVFGEVAVIFYPFSSSLMRRNENSYVYKVYESPSDIYEKDLNRKIQLMFSYAHYSSYMGNPDWMDFLNFKVLQVRSLARHIWHADWFAAMQARIDKIIGALSKEEAKTDDAEECDCE
ncbi:hypothetical protein [Aidingimonas lacisalsi]|uniref:hypothetical protein n=1 Tax=Aidingimonas lacisalsi TaxID=2604086 RepID=UPI0011D1894E|nr:hypothetical protein [Aidingimonas lacisalsi]